MGLVEVVVSWLIVFPVIAFIHELGHALAARRRVAGQVVVVFGADRFARRFRLSGIHFRLSPILRPWRIDARCHFAPHGVTAADFLVIVLAGPLATATTASLAYLGLGLTSGFAHSLVWMTVWWGAVMTIACLIPTTLTRRDGRFHTDGKLALEAFRRL